MTTELCLGLLRCESEQAVSQIVDDLPADVTWHPIDDRETNFNVVTNQASTGAKALTELCTNMVDAILLKRASEEGIDPTGPNAPQSVTDAVRILADLRGARRGILAEVDNPSYLRDYATKHLVIAVTGERGAKPCFTFIDSGEGQAPEDFKNTFCSLSSGRKKDIPFVQGKYNMGSSGVLSYCGRRWYKLILSRRHDRTSAWAWTLVRRRPGDGTPIAEYLHIGGVIPTITDETVVPAVLRDGQPDEALRRTTGTIIKVFSYEFGTATNFRTVREALNENLVSTVLPFRLMDYRAAPDRARGGRRALGVDERTISGMEFQLRRHIDDPEDDDDAERGGEPIHIADIAHPDLGRIRITAVPLPRDLPGWLKQGRNNNRVYHHVNGQVQFKQGRGFISQQCKLGALKDRVVVIVDASDMSEAAHNDVWKGDRETIRETEIGNLYVKEIQSAVRNSPTLKRLQEQIAREEIEHVAEEVQSELFQSVVDVDPHIAQILPDGNLVSLPGLDTPGNGGNDDFKGLHSPTFVSLIGRTLREHGIDVPKQGVRRVRFATDAENAWLTRPEDTGSVNLDKTASSLFSLSASLLDGSLAVTLAHIDQGDSPDTRFSASLVLTDPTMVEPVSEEIEIRLVDERKPQPSGRSGRRKKKGENDDSEPNSSGRGLPPTQWLTRDGRKVGNVESRPWPTDIGFSEQDGGKVEDLGEQMLYLINYDNAHLQRFMLTERNESIKRIIIEQYRLSMLVLMMGFEDAYRRGTREEDKNQLGEVLDEFRRLAARGAATVVLSIARTLPQMINPDALSDPDDD